MKKYKILIFIIVIAILVGTFGLLYFRLTKGERKTQNEKTIAEVEFLEGKIENLLNMMNNIEIRNYNVAVNEINTKESEKEKSDSANKSVEKETSQNEGNSNLDADGNITQNKEFKLESTSVLLRTDQVNWEKAKSEIETLYESVPTITLDLYQSQVQQEAVLNFNKELDEVTLMIQNKNKVGALKNLALLYDCIPKFMKKVSNNEMDNIVIETKDKLFTAYSQLDEQNWNAILDNVNQAINIYSQLLTNTNLDSNEQYTVNKVYIMLNELKNAVNIHDVNVFLIKYKNILEES